MGAKPGLRGGTLVVGNFTGDASAPAADPARRDLHKVFISYSRADFHFAEQLAGALRRLGLAVWFDVHELRPGTDWSSAIDRAITECDTFLLVASRTALESTYVQEEQERATELTRSVITVLPRRPAPPNLPEGPNYDLASSFKQGVNQIANDLTAGQPRGWRPRLPLPVPLSVFLAALAPVLTTVFAVVMAIAFAEAVAGQLISLLPNGPWAVGSAVSLIALVGIYSAYNSWAFIMRRASWLLIRGFQFAMPILALVAWVTVDTMAGYINEPWIFALGGQTTEAYLGDLTGALATGAALAGVLSAAITSFAPGVCRHLETGIAPARVRRRHMGPVPIPAETRLATHSFRLLSAEADRPVADEVRDALLGAGMAEASEESRGDRQVVVVSDRTPIEWLSLDELQEPLAVVATSIALPVRGVVQRFQWVDYRRRRRRTLVALARDLTAESSGHGPDPVLPEGLQRVQLPIWLRVVEWTLFAMATLALLIALYPLMQWGFTDRDADPWPSLLGLPIAAALVMVTMLVRRRNITPLVLVAVVAMSWLGMFACGLDEVARAMFDPSGEGPPMSPSLGYALVTALVFGLAWRSLSRWLPRRLRWKEPADETLGSAGGSWPWRVAVVPLALGFLSAAGLTAPADTSAPPIETLLDPPDVCSDRAEMLAFMTPLDAVTEAALVAEDPDTVRSAVEQRIQLMTGVLGDLGFFEPTGTWGTDMKARLVSGLEGVVQADQNYLDRGFTDSPNYEALAGVVEDINAPFC
jgi:hypothetical protein